MNVYVRVGRRHGLLASIGLAYVWLFVAVIRFALLALGYLVRLMLLAGLIYVELIRLTARLIAWSQQKEEDTR